MRPKSSVGAQTPLQALVRSQFARANEMMGDVLYKLLLDLTMVFHMTITILGFSYDDNVENMGLYMLVDFTQIIWLVVYLPPLKNMKVSWDHEISNIWKVKKIMFQTTNQFCV